LKVLKIRQDIDLNELEKYGFTLDENENEYARPVRWLNKETIIYLKVDVITREVVYRSYKPDVTNDSVEDFINIEMHPIALFKIKDLLEEGESNEDINN
jgi:hypothetical protein